MPLDIARKREKLEATGRPPIVLVDPQIRPALKQLTAAHIPQLIVLSYNEITRDTRIESVAMVSERRAASGSIGAAATLPSPHFRPRGRVG